MHSVPMLFVDDVIETSKWYQALLGAKSGHGGDEFEMLLGDKGAILQLHKIDDDHHDHSVDVSEPRGHGVVVVVYVASAESAFAKANDMNVEILSPLAFNEIANMHEFTARDPNGYALMVCEADWA